MVAAREIELRVVQPPRHVQVHPADAVLVMRDVISHRRNESGEVGPRRVGEILADGAARVGEPLRMARRLRVEQNARRLARARRDDDDARVDVLVLTRALVDVRDARRQTILPDRHLARHRVGEQR